MTEQPKALEGAELFQHLKSIDPSLIYTVPPGKPIREIQVTPIETRNEYNYLMMFWTVSHARRADYKKIKKQDERRGKLTGYSKQLFDACFRKW